MCRSFFVCLHSTGYGCKQHWLIISFCRKMEHTKNTNSNNRIYDFCGKYIPLDLNIRLNTFPTYFELTMSPGLTFGLFFLGAPSKAREEREAGSLVPISTLISKMEIRQFIQPSNDERKKKGPELTPPYCNLFNHPSFSYNLI